LFKKDINNWTKDVMAEAEKNYKIEAAAN